MLITIPQSLSRTELLIQIAISLWIILLVCIIFTPIIQYWYKSRHRNVIAQIRHLTEMKKLKSEHKRPTLIENSKINENA